MYCFLLICFLRHFRCCFHSGFSHKQNGNRREDDWNQSEQKTYVILEDIASIMRFRIASGIWERVPAWKISCGSPIFCAAPEPAEPFTPLKASLSLFVNTFVCTVPKMVTPKVMPNDRKNEFVELAVPENEVQDHS